MLNLFEQSHTAPCMQVHVRIGQNMSKCTYKFPSMKYDLFTATNGKGTPPATSSDCKNLGTPPPVVKHLWSMNMNSLVMYLSATTKHFSSLLPMVLFRGGKFHLWPRR